MRSGVSVKLVKSKLSATLCGVLAGSAHVPACGVTVRSSCLNVAATVQSVVTGPVV